MNFKSKIKNMPLGVKVSTAYILCSIVQNGIGFITLPLFTRMLSTEEYGQVTVYTSWLSVLTVFITLNLAYGSFSKAMVKYEKERNEYITSVEVICFIIAGIFLGVYSIFRGFFSKVLELPTYIVIVMIVEILANAVIQFWCGKKRFEFRYKEVVAFTIITSVVSPIVQFILISNSADKGYAKIIGTASVTVFSAFILLIYGIQKSNRICTKEHMLYALSFNIPLLIYYLSQMIFNTSDRIMISHMCDNEKAALYGVVYNIVLVLNMILAAINNSYIPWVYKKINEKEQEDNNRIFMQLTVIVAVFVVMLVWCSPEIIFILAGKKYMEAVGVVAPVAISVLVLFFSQVFINYEFFYEDKLSLNLGSVLAAVVNIVLNYWLIPLCGYQVAAYTTLLSYIMFAAFNYSRARKLWKKNSGKDDFFSRKSIMGVAVCAMCASYIGIILYNYIFVRIGVVVVFLIVLLVERNKIIKVVKIG